jgi:hypothetical protein
MMAYTRFDKNRGLGFNGVDKVRKVRASVSKEVRISNESTHQLLSNQRAYGIWGKYIRPFTDMKMTQDPDFHVVFGQKAKSSKELIQLSVSLKKKVSETAFVNLDKLAALQGLIDKPTGAERKFFIKYLLKDNFTNELLNLLTNSIKDTDIGFYQLLDNLYNHSDHIAFKNTISFIKNTELTLSPLNHVYRYLQTHSYWSYQSI